MKKLVGLVVILAALVLGGYYVMGIATERTVKHDLATVNKSNGLFVNIVSYKRGWFSSTAQLDWKLHVPEHLVKTDGQSETVPAQDFEMQMPLVIHHGPIIFANNTVKFGLGYANTEIPLPNKYVEQFNNNFTPDSIKPQLDLSLFVTYLNNSQIEMSIPAFKLKAKQGGGEFEWKGMSSTVKVTSDADKIKGDFTVEGMQFQANDVKAVLSEISSEYSLHKTENGLYLGDASMSFPSMVVNKKDVKMFELNKLDLYSSSEIDDGLFNSHFKTSVDKIFADGKDYGPGSIEMAVRNLDAVALGHINEQVQHAQQGSDLEKQQAWLAVIPEIPKLLSRGPEFEISELNFAMPQGTIEGNLLVSLPASDNQNPLELMQKVQGKGKLKVPVDVIKMALTQSNLQKLNAAQALQDSSSENTTSTSISSTDNAQAATTQDTSNTVVTSNVATTTDLSQQADAMTTKQISAMMESGLIVQDDNYYVIEVVLEQGKLLVNGKPFDPAMIKF